MDDSLLFDKQSQMHFKHDGIVAMISAKVLYGFILIE